MGELSRWIGMKSWLNGEVERIQCNRFLSIKGVARQSELGGNNA